MEKNEVFMQGKRKYVVTGFDAQGRPIATCNAEAVAAAEKAAENSKKKKP